MRKLASVKIIKELLPIEGADRIEIAKLEGIMWQCVVGKGLHKVGDKVIYCEIDSILPAEHFPDLEKCNYRIKTMKLRGCLSQGFIIPLNVALEIARQNQAAVCLDTGSDWTQALGVTKYEPPAQFMMGDMAGPFPSHLVEVTDEERIQNIPEICEELRGKPYWITVKMDGTSASYVLDDQFFVCSRNNARKDGDNVYWNLARRYDIENVLRRVDGRFSIQGEAVGPGIQKNPLGLDKHDLFVFSITDKYTRQRMNYDDMFSFCANFGLTPVPLLEKGDNFQYTPEQLLALAEGKYPSGKEREGIVIRGTGRSKVRKGDYMSFKAISNRFLARGGD